MSDWTQLWDFPVYRSWHLWYILWSLSLWFKHVHSNQENRKQAWLQLFVHTDSIWASRASCCMITIRVTPVCKYFDCVNRSREMAASTQDLQGSFMRGNYAKDDVMTEQNLTYQDRHLGLPLYESLIKQSVNGKCSFLLSLILVFWRYSCLMRKKTNLAGGLSW